LYGQDQRRLAFCLNLGAFRLSLSVLRFSFYSITLFKLEKQAARRSAEDTATGLAQTYEVSHGSG
jgi:hypothetical protein